MTPAPNSPTVEAGDGLAPYSAGLLSDFGGGDVAWWQDYLRAELDRAHDFYQSQSDAISGKLDEARARCIALTKALTPSAETKYVYIGEVKFAVSTGFDEDGCEIWQDITVPWTTTKDIMAMILGHAAMLDHPAYAPHVAAALQQEDSSHG